MASLSAALASFLGLLVGSFADPTIWVVMISAALAFKRIWAVLAVALAYACIVEVLVGLLDESSGVGYGFFLPQRIVSASILGGALWAVRKRLANLRGFPNEPAVDSGRLSEGATSELAESEGATSELAEKRIKPTAKAPRPAERRALSGNVHEGFRRLTILISGIWAVATILLAGLRYADSLDHKQRVPIADALEVGGISAAAYCAAFFTIKALTWIVNGFRNRAMPRGHEVNARVAWIAGLSGLFAVGISIAIRQHELIPPAQESLVVENATVQRPAPQLRLIDIIITQEEFQRVELGASYDRAVEIIGAEGREIDAYTIGDWRFVQYQWTNESGFGYATMKFRNEELVEKQPFGLPQPYRLPS